MKEIKRASDVRIGLAYLTEQFRVHLTTLPGGCLTPDKGRKHVKAANNRIIYNWMSMV